MQLAGVGEGAHPVVLDLVAADRDAGGAQHEARLLADRVEHLVEAVRRRHRAGDRDQRAQLRLERAVGAHARQLGRRLRAAVVAGDVAAVEHAQQRGDRRRAELRAGVALELDPRLRLGQRAAVRPVGGHRVPGVADQADAARERDVLPREAVGIAAAVPALVLRPHGGREVGERADRVDDPRADRRVLAHHVPLGGGQAAGLAQDRVGHADLADVVQQRDLADRGGVVGVHPQLGGDRQRELEHRLGVLGGVVLTRVERGDQRLAGGRLDLGAAVEARALGVLDPRGGDAREAGEVAQVALAEVGARAPAEAAERAVDRAVRPHDGDAGVGADPGRDDERVRGGRRARLRVGDQLRDLAGDHRVAPRVVARQREAGRDAAERRAVAVDAAQDQRTVVELGQIGELHPERLASGGEQTVHRSCIGCRRRAVKPRGHEADRATRRRAPAPAARPRRGCGSSRAPRAR